MPSRRYPCREPGAAKTIPIIGGKPKDFFYGLDSRVQQRVRSTTILKRRPLAQPSF
ncbi:MAG: hypothetical protein ACT6RN_15505 [Agrobacterium sp.]|uniref:hypothetical protein n=1 Tax=Agrobacterium sp. TaxID=361 RepID=UPI004037E4F5